MVPRKGARKASPYRTQYPLNNRMSRRWEQKRKAPAKYTTKSPVQVQEMVLEADCQLQFGLPSKHAGGEHLEGRGADVSGK
ncbi:hypothetical protein JTB14_017004 [Gonioctena quinquepunctata]|nr:hypothetical protein JTB14_017004 [Gonioctena quinquepunctata]